MRLNSLLVTFLLHAYAAAQTTTLTIKSAKTACHSKCTTTRTSNTVYSTSTYEQSIIRSLTFSSAPTSTVTPPAKVYTTTVKTVVTSTQTAPATTRTATSTTFSTVFTTIEEPAATSTSTFTSTEVVTSTEVIVFNEPTVTPIQDTLPGSSLVRRGLEVVARNAKSGDPDPYPYKIECYVAVKVYLIRVVVVRGSITKTITAGTPTRKTTVTSTSTSTTTSYPGASTTTVLTSTTTSTIVTTPAPSTTLTTVTSTSTAVAVSTSYPQCGPRNQASYVNGLPIFNLFDGGEGALDAALGTGSSPTDCCINCLLDPTCGAYRYQFPVRSFGDRCFFYILTGNICPTPRYSALAGVLSAGGTSNNVVGNGKCINIDGTENVAV